VSITLTVMFIGVLIFLAHLFSIMYARTQIPDVLLLFLVGFLFGPVLQIIKPAHFGAIGQVFTTITLILILFDSGVGMSLKGLRRSARGLFSLTILAFITSMFFTAGAAYLFTKLDFLPALMLGAIVGGTSSAVVIPILDKLRISNNASRILVFESVINDVLCIVMTFSLIATFQQGEMRLGYMVLRIVATFTLAGILGVMFAIFWSTVLDKVRVLQFSTFTTLAFVFIVYGIIELLGFSGAIGALVFGYVLNNMSKFKLQMFRFSLELQQTELNEKERNFFGEVVFLLKTFFFFYIGISIRVVNIGMMLLGMVIVMVLFLLRIVVVRIALPASTLRTDANYIAVVIPKGLAAAVLATIPLQQGIPNGEIIQNLTYTIVLFSIVLSSILTALVDQPIVGNFYQKFWRGKFSLNSHLEAE